MDSEIRKAVRQRDKLLKDAYHGRNGLSMTETQRADYKAMMERARAARRISRGR